jgi:hypothetical protein
MIFYLCFNYSLKISEMTKEYDKFCLVCKRNDKEVPLINMSYRGSKLWICPQHIPVLIHDPEKLTGTLPGAEDFEPAEE